MEQKRDALYEKLDPYQVSLRDKLAQTLQADYIGAFSKTEGVARVKKGGKWFYIDKRGKQVF